MKKSKLVLVIVLALVLCITCISSPTFSWYTRPKEQSGNSLSWSGNYDISNGNGVTMQTFASADGGKTYTEEVTDFSESGGLSAGGCKYYRTEISNSSSYAQSVSLYLSKLTLPESSQGNFYLGVNDPLKTYKTYGSSVASGGRKVTSSINEQNVYLGLHSDAEEMTKLPPTIDFIHAWNDDGVSSDCSWSNAVDTGSTGSWSLGSSYWKDASQTFNIYAMKIDYRCTKFQFVQKSNNYYSDPQPTISSNNTIVYFEYDKNYIAQAKQSGTAAGISTFYSSASVAVGDTINLAATGKGTITYTSSDTSVATVNPSTGVVTALKAGSTIITATSTGAYGDTITSTCNVTVEAKESYEKADVPIVTNFKISAASEDAPEKQYVYWYIKNDSSTSNLTYSIDEIYLSL